MDQKIKTMEIWKPVKDYEGLYEVSNLGNVKSLFYKTTGKPKLLKPAYSVRRKYYSVCLTKNKKMKTIPVHLLMAKSFLNHKPKETNLIVDHKNNDSLDNTLSNLQLITIRENNSKDKKGSSIYTGVSWTKERRLWFSTIYHNKKTYRFGFYEDEKIAAKAYQYAFNKIKNNEEIDAKKIKEIFGAKKK